MFTISAGTKGFLPLQLLAPTACEMHVFDNLQSASLLSLGQLCDNGCTVLLNKNSLHIFKNLKHIILGFCNRSNGLWVVPLQVQPPNMQQKMNVIIKKSTTKKDLIHFATEPVFPHRSQHFLKPFETAFFCLG